MAGNIATVVVFSSNIFLAYFLPLFVLAYVIVPSRYKNATALIGSFLFYAWGAPMFCFLLLASSGMDFFIAQLMQKVSRPRPWLTLGLAVNLLTLLTFKYFNFFLENARGIAEGFGYALPEFVEVALPIGISFFTFQKISFLVDVYRSDAPVPRSLPDYLLFVFLFPQLIAGPIVRFKELAGQLQDRRASENARHRLEGFYRFVAGLAKKVLIADTVAELADQAFANAGALDALSAWIGILAYSVQIYFDFSGYSDMAIGLGMMMGFRFPENFNFPYLSGSFSEFWRRWHITLGKWMRDYLYVPLGGNRNGKTSTYLNLWIVFALSGLWHGASWTFVAWGLYHGFFLVLERVFDNARLPRWVDVPLTALAVCLGWVLFRADTFSEAMEYYRSLFNFHASFHLDVNPKQITFLWIGALGSIWGIGKLQEKASWFYTLEKNGNTAIWRTLAYLLLLFVCMGSLARGDVHPFIYFRF